MIKFVLNRGLSRPLFYSRVPAMEHLRLNNVLAEKGEEVYTEKRSIAEYPRLDYSLQ